AGVDCQGQRPQTGGEGSGNPYAVLSILMTLTASCLMSYILIEASSEHDIDELHSITYSENRFLSFMHFAQQGKLEIRSVPFRKLQTSSGDHHCFMIILWGNVPSTRDHEAVHKFGNTGYVIESGYED